VLNYGQMLLFHIVLFPLALGVLVVLHVLLVRRRGVVPPFADKEQAEQEPTGQQADPSAQAPQLSAQPQTSTAEVTS
jgi:ubiquinol-cytochrome c reductase cytochrome b subunit